MFRLRIVNHTDTTTFQDRDVTSLRPDHVRRNHTIVQKADALEISDRLAPFALTLSSTLASFRKCASRSCAPVRSEKGARGFEMFF
jgi:hypothetical protein